MNNERENALKEIHNFGAYLSSFLTDRNTSNARRKAYSPEFKVLIKGRTQISRMLLFSKENVTKLFTNFGLSFVRHEHQEAFSNLKDLVSEVKKYSKPRGRFSRFLASMSQVKVLFEAVTATIGVILVILKILGVF